MSLNFNIFFMACLSILNPVMGFKILNRDIMLQTHLEEDISSFWCQNKNLQHYCRRTQEPPSCVGIHFKAMFFTATKDEKIFAYNNYILGSILPYISCPVKIERPLESPVGQKPLIASTENASVNASAISGKDEQKSTPSIHQIIFTTESSKIEVKITSTQSTSMEIPDNISKDEQRSTPSIIKTVSSKTTPKMTTPIIKDEAVPRQISTNGQLNADAKPSLIPSNANHEGLHVVSGTTHWCWILFMIALLSFGIIILASLAIQSGFIRSVHTTRTIRTPNIEQEENL